MPETNRENIRSEIEVLEQQLKERKMALEKGGIENKEAEITKENVSENELSNVQPVQTKTTFTPDESKDSEIKTDIKKIKDLDTGRQIKVLTTLAFEKGIMYSIKVARGLNNAYLLDGLHDKLIGELHEELIRKGKLKDL